KQEEWKYTYFNNIIKNIDILANNNTIPNSINNDYIDAICYSPNRLVFVNGQFQSALSSLEQNPKIIFWNGIADNFIADNNFLIQLNQALSTDALHIELADNLLLENPIELVYINTNANSMLQHHNQIKVGKNTQVQFIEHYINDDNFLSYMNNYTTISVAENAVVQWYKIQDAGNQLNITDNTYINQDKTSVCSVFTTTLSANIVRNVLHFASNGEHTESNMYGLYLLNNNEHVDNRTQVDHKVANCNSNELYKGIIGGEAVGVFNGKIIVHKDAQKTNAFQSNKNILISDEAHVYTKPQLEIYADDVKCSHGATIAQIEDSELFYLRSRGIDKESAKNYLSYAFALEVIESISNKNIRELLIKKIAKKLNIDIE
ncbi:MAG: Fe-S cluster assembly protein SufD, partial [Romboutsia sp.]|nr:Fe-S cluster assembly protein SufD [Romboutsia sp.]